MQTDLVRPVVRTPFNLAVKTTESNVYEHGFSVDPSSELGGLGIQVYMITGDHVALAKETCRVIGMGTDSHDPRTSQHGVNDAASMKKANVGIAVEGAAGH